MRVLPLVLLAGCGFRCEGLFRDRCGNGGGDVDVDVPPDPGGLWIEDWSADCSGDSWRIWALAWGPADVAWLQLTDGFVEESHDMAIEPDGDWTFAEAELPFATTPGPGETQYGCDRADVLTFVVSMEGELGFDCLAWGVEPELYEGQGCTIIR